MISQLFSQDCFKVLSLFSLSPGSRFNRDEIKAKVLLNNVPLDAALARLLSSGVLVRVGNFYSLNFESDFAKVLVDLCRKQHKLLKELPLVVYYLLLDFVSALSSVKGVEVLLFGSYSKLVFTEKSDIDLAVLTIKRVDKVFFNGLVLKLEKVYGKNVEVHFFDKRSFLKSKKDPLVKDILKNGIRLF